MFKKEINPFSVTDKAVFRNMDKTLTLYVKADASALVLNLKKAQDAMTSLTDESSESAKRDAARMFARAIFGTEQSDKLFHFYDCDPITLITACGVYFRSQLSKKITKAQKK